MSKNELLKHCARLIDDLPDEALTSPSTAKLEAGHCPEEAKKSLCAAKCATMQTLCAIICAEHDLGCHDH